jgi:hypothetical protein
MAQIPTTSARYLVMAERRRLLVVLKDVSRYLPPTEYSIKMGYDPMEPVMIPDVKDMLVGTFEERDGDHDLFRIRCPFGAISTDIHVTDAPVAPYLNYRSEANTMFKDNPKIYPSGTVELSLLCDPNDGSSVYLERYFFILHVIDLDPTQYTYYETDDPNDFDADTRVANVDRGRVLLRHSDFGPRLLAIAVAQRRRRPRLPNELLLMVFTEFILSDYEV